MNQKGRILKVGTVSYENNILHLRGWHVDNPRNYQIPAIDATDIRNPKLAGHTAQELEALTKAETWLKRFARFLLRSWLYLTSYRIKP